MFQLLKPANLVAMVQPFKGAFWQVFLVTFGLALGLIFAYNLPPLQTVFTSGDPVHLTSGNKDSWIKNTALAYQQGALTDAEAKTYLEEAGYGPSEIEALANENVGTPYEAPLRSVQPLPSQSAADDAQARVNSSAIGNILTPLLCLIGFFMLGAIGIIFNGLVMPVLGPLLFSRRREETELGKAMGQSHAASRAAIEEAKAAAAADTAAIAQELGEPVASFMSAYVFGDNLYDDSFAVEPDGGFAGECGIGISETIGVGDPKKVTALEVWVFDQAEIQTLTYLMVSEHAYNDPGLRDKLAPRGEVVMVSPGGSFFMETRSLRMRVQVIALEYGEGSLPPNSFFNKLSVSMSVWLKEGAEIPGAGATLGITGNFDPLPLPQAQPLPTYAPPPQAQPMPMTPPPMQGQPLQPPPMQGQPLPPPPMGQPMMPPQGQGQPYPGQPMMPPQGGMPMQGQPPMGQGQPFPGQPMMPPQGGIRPLPGQPMPPQGQPFPGQQPLQPPPMMGRAPMPPGGQMPPMPRQAPPEDDPFGDTGQM